MRTQEIYFPDRQTLCVFPDGRSDLAQAISVLGLDYNNPVIVLIGGDIDQLQAVATQRAILSISHIAEEMNTAVICGGTDMGIMAEIGQIREQKNYNFPLIGITPEDLVTWPGSPSNKKFLWRGKQRWQLEPHYSHFILVPGTHFGDESPWIVDAATILSEGNQSVTILINGGDVSRTDIELSLENGRPVIVVSGTGRLADELSRQPNRHTLITIVPASNEQRIFDVIRAALSVDGKDAKIQPVNKKSHPVIH